MFLSFIFYSLYMLAYVCISSKYIYFLVSMHINWNLSKYVYQLKFQEVKNIFTSKYVY